MKLFKFWQFYNILQRKEFEQADQELNILEHDIKAAKTFLKLRKKNIWQRYSKTPKYIIIGSSHSGKTTLLTNSGLELLNVNQDPLKDVVPTKYCSWWFSKDAVYLDTAGIYTKPEIERPRDEIVWSCFLKSLKKYFGNNFVQGAIVVLDLPQLSTNQALAQQTLFYLRDRIYEIARLIKNLPLYIVFTKCDLVSGFSAFFESLDSEQRAQSFGINFCRNSKIHDPSLSFNNQFDLLLQRVYNHLLPRLHQERQLEQRLLLSNFPIQLEALRPFIANVLNKIPTSTNIHLHGIYFTSSIQKGEPIDYLNSTCKNLLDFVDTPNFKHTLSKFTDYSFFTHDLFKKIVTLPPKVLDKNTIKSLLCYITLVTSTFGALLSSYIFWQANYTSNIKLLQLAHTTISSPQMLNDFAKLKDLNQQLETQKNSLWLKLGVNKINGLNAQIKQIYQSASNSNYIIQAKDFIESELTTASSAADPHKVYNDLKMYLLFNAANNSDTEFVQNWFRDFSINKLNSNPDQLREAANLILQHAVKVKTDPKIIAAAQQTLKNFPKEQLAFLFLENKFVNDNLYLSADNSVGIFTNFAFSIPSIYTAEKFNTIYNQEIPNLLNHGATDDKVIGNFKLQFTPDEKLKLNAAIKNIYLTNYANAWGNILNMNIGLVTAKDIAQVTQQLNVLADTNSPLLKILKLIQDNTHFATAPTQLEQLVTTKLGGLNTIDLNTLQSNLTALNNYFVTINKNPDVNKAAFSATLSRFQDPTQHDPISLFQKFATQQPKPLQQWLLNIANNSWQALFNPTQDYLSSIWKDTVYPQYQKLIENKYPIFNHAETEMSLNDFNKFFGPNGVIDSFFTIYLRPFVDTDQMYWTWKNLNGQKLNFSQNSLEIFIRAALIQKMFYGEQTITPSVRFTLTPIAMNPNTKNFMLDLEGQKISYITGANRVDQLVWPGPLPQKVTLEFTNKMDKHFTITHTGPWAWFRLLDKSSLQTINNSQHFDLTFDLNGNSIKYELITAQTVNPFIPDILRDFRCTNTL